MKTMVWRRGLLLLLPFLLAGLFASTVCADEGDPPGRVARLSLVQGKVTFQPSGESDWSEASVNRPVTTGDRLYTDQGARAELEVGSFAVRLSQGTDVTLANLNDQLMQLGVGQGTLRVTVYEMPENNSVEIDTPNGALILQAAGSYRVDTARRWQLHPGHRQCRHPANQCRRPLKNPANRPSRAVDGHRPGGGIGCFRALAG